MPAGRKPKLDIPIKKEFSQDELMMMLVQMKQEIDALKGNKVENISTEEVYPEEELIEIPINKSIRLVSLYNGGLTLFTQARGTGKPYRFNGFGTTRTIIYSDLIDCIAHQNRYFSDGFVMILDKDVNKAQGLDDVVKTFLTKSQIENILSFDAETISKMLKNTTKNILTTVVENVTFALVEDKPLDMNKVKAVSDVYGRDINEVVSILKETKELLKPQ